MTPNRDHRTTESGRFEDDERAISDIIGYVLTIGIILIGVGIVGTVGVDQMERIQGTQKVENAERAVTVVAGNFDELQESRASARTSEISVTEGRIGVDLGSDPSAIQVDVLNKSFDETRDMNTFTYEVDDTHVSYEGGSVAMAGRTGDSIAIRDPKLVCSDNRAVVSFVTLRADGGGGGEGYSGDTATITARTVESRVRHSPSRDDPITATGVDVTVDTAYEGAWTDFLVESGGWSQVGASNTYRCEPPGGGTMPVIVRQTVVDVTLSR